MSPIKRNWISAVILFHLIVVPVGSNLSIRKANLTGIEKFMADYVYAMQIMQYWGLFSPEPRKQALKYHALITYRDGTTRPWIRPYPPKWDFFARHLSYNFQKWDLVGNYLDHRTELWVGLVQYLQKVHRDDFNPVTKIQFLRASAPWPPPNPTGHVGGDEKDLVWSDTLLFTYDVSQRSFL